MRTSMSVLAGLCPTQKLSKGLRRTKAKPALSTGASSVQQHGCNLKRATKSPLQDHNVQRVWSIRNLLSVAILRCWLFYGVNAEQGEGKGAPVCRKQPGGLLGILERLIWRDWVCESWNIPQIIPKLPCPKWDLPCCPQEQPGRKAGAFSAPGPADPAPVELCCWRLLLSAAWGHVGNVLIGMD